ncbi:MAG: excinuclease ABC subunit UvrA [Thermogemmata sp.]|uniref:UvrABC system protein A n=1 Tax=Thermogemmata fonticola TaxID=2755323 RepID=A0A7V8VCL7_9BACT|nr:excinuclease ABC subunit UvrA [Thermogemmata fonticola]MBA2225496.1 excinuclease ABC subunit UvrA [Thermogemmata fonticola]MCX8139952.1 excinuclease ABC subunit UvrA [Gemmataceae bacterium]
MDTTRLVVRGAREHNLQNVDLDLPRERLIVFTGVSGSGKSSLAFDTLYAEGQRRYLESLSSYARQFLDQLPKPNVDYIGGLSPAISIQQKTAGRNPRSTVGTITEIVDYLRVLFARLGQGHCPRCDRPITAQSREQIIGQILSLPPGQRVQILAPIIRGQKGEYKDLCAEMVKRGYTRARINGQWVRLDEDIHLDRRLKHTIEIVVDRLQLRDPSASDSSLRVRIAEAVEQALSLGQGTLIVHQEALTEPPSRSRPIGSAASLRSEAAVDARSDGTDLLLSAHYACSFCQMSYDPPTPQMFSFNSPQGMCPQCDGLGTSYTFDPQLLVPDPSKSLYEGAIPLIGAVRSMGRWRRHIYEGVARSFGIDLKKPWSKLKERERRLLLYGSDQQLVTWRWRQSNGQTWEHFGYWEGIIPQLMSQFKKSSSGPRRRQMEKYMRIVRCPECHGYRLNAQARAVRLGGKTIVELGEMPIGQLALWFEQYQAQLTPVQRLIAEDVLREIRNRLDFLLQVGLHYLTLDRPAPTLSGGEAQRIRLAAQIGSGLVGVLYVLDEPSIGLHPRDNARLLASLQRLRDMGNTIIVVEHDEETMRAADVLVDFGPGPGHRGGQIVALGPPQHFLQQEHSLTAQYLSGRKQIPTPPQRRRGNGRVLRIVGASHNNLKNITVDIPLGCFVCVTGVSGSGKSSLVNDVLLCALQERLRSRANGRSLADDETNDDEVSTDGPVPATAGAHERLEGIEHIDKVIAIDQSPIGRTPRSNPATYIKLWDEIRLLYAQMPEAKVRGYKPGRFSFNKPGGRCDACEGNGARRLDMDFLADVWVTCPVCEGRRFNRETLQVRYRGKSIHDVLEMEVAEALEHFENVPKIRAMLQTLHDVGLDYLKLGQPSPTLSGGEAQRIKLARELIRRSTGRTLYILDEPTTGLHFEDVRKLLEVLHNFVAAGNTVLVIEHHLDVIKTADWIIDLGPEGGEEGGQIVAVGTPEEIARCPHSYTGQALARLFGIRPQPVAFTESRSRRKKATNGKPSRADSLASTPLSEELSPRDKRLTHIDIRGACQHNLKNISTRIPREQMTVFCGPSGSGKSSLALDTIYAEGQRRYVESLSTYARQFLGPVQKPKVEQISGLSPAICIEQKTSSRSPRSTVGTITEIYDYLRILYARLGVRHCPNCGQAIGTQTTDEIVDKILSLPPGTKIYVLAPLERKGQEKYSVLWEEARRSGYTRVRVDGVTYSLDEVPNLDHRRKHEVEVVVDRLVIRPALQNRLSEAVEQALALGRGVVRMALVDPDRPEPQWRVMPFSKHLACERCQLSFEPLQPHHYSFNSPLGWCPNCEGLGIQRGVAAEQLGILSHRTLRQGAIPAWPSCRHPQDPWTPFAEALARYGGFDLDTPWQELTPEQQQLILYGSGNEWIPLAANLGTSEDSARFSPRRKKTTPQNAATLPQHFQYKGIIPALDEAARLVWHYRQHLQPLLREVPCLACRGSRLRADAAATRFAGLTLGELCHKTIAEVEQFFANLSLSQEEQHIAGEVLREIRQRLHFLVEVGLEYLTLARPGPTLSGGEAQRIRLAAQVGSGLTGVLYVLDEPTIGLHPRDNHRLLQALQRLRDLGNTLIVVEHDREMIRSADYVLDFGPGAGREGGQIVASASPQQLLELEHSLTGKYLSGRQAIPQREHRRSPGSQWLRLQGINRHNLKNLDVAIPLGLFVAITGVSGSGKSTLVHDVLYQAAALRLAGYQTLPVDAPCQAIEGVQHLDKIIRVDQDPLGKSPTSMPATYTGVFDHIRALFARLPEAKVRGYTAGRFSLHIPGGRCDACEGLGQKRIEMHFLPDVWIPCEVCHGKRYNPETLAVTYRGKSIADVLDLPIREALHLFSDHPKIERILRILDDVGLGYLSLGQPAHTLSGGEAQRVKLAAELARPTSGKTLYILDEPTTGLHFEDIRRLLDVLHRLVDAGHTVLVVEHNLDVIQTADWIIDLGPEAGEGGGKVVASGPPEEIVRLFQAGRPTHTGRFLAERLATSAPLLASPSKPAQTAPKSPRLPAPVSFSSPHLSHSCARETPPAASALSADGQGIASAAPSCSNSGPPALSSIERHMPWVRNWEAWHTGPKGFPPAQTRRWPIALLKTLLEHARQLCGNHLLLHSQPTAILLHLSLPDATGELCRITTKHPDALIVECDLSASQAKSAEFRRWQSFASPSSSPRGDSAKKITTLRLALSCVEDLETTAVLELLRLLYERLASSCITARSPTPRDSRRVSTPR